ncbi:hypothetical protein QBC35DRAFT_289123 [Podospora australis]|uniref:Thymidylate kinase n=1 Tax=Podospora australis TaxID=1536484 RepID=A0AAN6WPD7_9PEZI|nr:hypothetical protein QBC35DRAFT_289123 [Podospora australis]
MATLSRQPFAPLDHTRLKTLTSLKNRQNAIPTAPVKRKASEVADADDFENVDPVFFPKRPKGDDSKGGSGFNKTYFKPSTFVLTKAASSTNLQASTEVKPSASSFSRPRNFLQPKSPAARLTSITTAATPRTAPAGRSPTRGSKRIGILSKRRHTQRIDPPSFGLASSVPFSLDAALKGSIPAYSGSLRSSSNPSDSLVLGSGDMQSSWFFDIHEDTPEQEMTNLLQHGTCTLDISSDEESEKSRDRAEGRDKENIPPADDISQTNFSRSARVLDIDDMVIEKQRGPLAEMNVADYYAEGCDEESVILIPGDEDEEEDHAESSENVRQLPPVPAFHDEPRHHQEVEEQQPETHAVTLADVESVSVDDIMGNGDPSKATAVLEPIEGTGESFELWESTSAKDEGSVPASPSPLSAHDDEENAVPV